MYLEITNDIHLGLKFGCCNAENRKREYDKRQSIKRKDTERELDRIRKR